MHTLQEFEELIAYRYCAEEEKLYPLMSAYFQDKYGVEIQKIRYYSGENTGTFGVWLTTNRFFQQVYRQSSMDDWRLHFPADAAKVKEIIYQQGLQGYFHINNLYISFESFELDALHYCYSTAFQEYKKFRDRYFNPDSMEYIDSSGMFVVYKTRELMEQAAVNGEQARIRKDYYRFMQKYDTYRFIKQDKHLLVDFDYAENARSPREYSELYWKMLGEE